MIKKRDKNIPEHKNENISSPAAVLFSKLNTFNRISTSADFDIDH
ncbi:MAG TPA: hypothetical protein PLY52_04940 [Methanothrix sp.]|nr:hypothetical protein [Methanothrix sp.]